MADDVASFFKSKKSKKQGPGHGHSAIVHTPDELARRLERTVQQQQIFERENGIDVEGEDLGNSRPPYTQQLSGGGGAGGGGTGGGGGGGEQNEDSEWLDVHEQQEVDLAKLGMKELEIREESEDEANEDEESLVNRKTWNIPGQPGEKSAQKPSKVTYAAGMDIDDGEEVASGDDSAAAASKKEAEAKKQEDTENSKVEQEKAETAEKKQAYVPPSLRHKQLLGAARPTYTKKPNIEDSMEFPSLAAAGELEAEIEKTKKKQPPQQRQMKKAWSPSPASAPSAAPAETGRLPAWSSEPKSAAAVAAAAAEPEKPAEPRPGSYVPPHLRKRN